MKKPWPMSHKLWNIDEPLPAQPQLLTLTTPSPSEFWEISHICCFKTIWEIWRKGKNKIVDIKIFIWQNVIIFYSSFALMSHAHTYQVHLLKPIIFYWVCKWKNNPSPSFFIESFCFFPFLFSFTSAENKDPWYTSTLDHQRLTTTN